MISIPTEDNACGGSEGHQVGMGYGTRTNVCESTWSLDCVVLQNCKTEVTATVYKEDPVRTETPFMRLFS